MAYLIFDSILTEDSHLRKSIIKDIQKRENLDKPKFLGVTSTEAEKKQKIKENSINNNDRTYRRYMRDKEKLRKETKKIDYERNQRKGWAEKQIDDGKTKKLNIAHILGNKERNSTDPYYGKLAGNGGYDPKSKSYWITPDGSKKFEEVKNHELQHHYDNIYLKNKYGSQKTRNFHLWQSKRNYHKRATEENAREVENLTKNGVNNPHKLLKQKSKFNLDQTMNKFHHNNIYIK